MSGWARRSVPQRKAARSATQGGLPRSGKRQAAKNRPAAWSAGGRGPWESYRNKTDLLTQTNKKDKTGMYRPMMTIKIAALAAVATFAAAPAAAEDVAWYDGSRAVTYSVQKKVDPVVEVALQMFASDMKAVTGR